MISMINHKDQYKFLAQLLDTNYPNAANSTSNNQLRKNWYLQYKEHKVCRSKSDGDKAWIISNLWFDIWFS